MAEKKRRRLIVVVASVVVVIVLAAVLGPYIYIHFIEGPPPKSLTLPSVSKGGRTPAPFPTGQWKATSASVASRSSRSAGDRAPGANSACR